MNRLSIYNKIVLKTKHFSKLFSSKNTELKNALKYDRKVTYITAGVFTAGAAGYAFYNSKYGRDFLGIHVTDDVKIIKKDNSNLIDQIEEKKVSDKIKNGIPTEIPYLIIGGGVAGMSAARSIRASDPLSKILIINNEPGCPNGHSESYLPYRRGLLSRYIWRRNENLLNDLLDSSGDVKHGSYLFLEPDSFYISPDKIHESEFGGISLLKGHKVIEIDPSTSSIKLDCDNHRITYKACLIATGALPTRLESLEKAVNTGSDLYSDGRVSYFRGLNDFRTLYEKIKSLRNKEVPAKILVVGGGLLATELTSSLSRMATDQGKLEVIEVFKEKSPLFDILPEPLSKYIRNQVSAQKVKIISESDVISIGEITEGSDNGRLSVSIKPLSSTTENKSNIIENVDHVIITVGNKPNTELAKSANLPIDPNLKGFAVNEEFELSKGLFVAGESCSFVDKLLGRRSVGHWNSAEETGLIAGHNMAAHVLKSIENAQPAVDYSINAFDVLKPQVFQYQPSLSFKMNVYNSLEAIGLVDSSLETRTFVATDFFDENFDLDNQDTPAKDSSQSSSDSKEHDPLDMPGVVFYLKNKKVVGVLLWNCDDDIIIDTEFPSPLRSNVARKILAEQKSIETERDLLDLAANIDLSFYVNSQMKFLEEFSKKRKEEQASDAAVQLT